MTEFKGYFLTSKESEALEALLKEMRAKAEHEALVKRCKDEISFAVSSTILEIGLAETKTIVREIARELRGVKSDDC